MRQFTRFPPDMVPSQICQLMFVLKKLDVIILQSVLRHTAIADSTRSTFSKHFSGATGG